MKLCDLVKIFCFVLVGNAVGWGRVAADDTQGKWMLMSRHGECADISALKRKVPNLPEVSDVSSLIDFFNSEGHSVQSKELPGSEGRAYQVDIPDMSLNLVLVRESLCAQR